MYKAMATIKARGRQWNITICDMYRTVQEAEEGIKRFRHYAGGNVVKTWIEEI